MASGDESNVSYHGEDQVECQDSSDSESANNLTKGSNLEQLKSLREKVNWENEEDRLEFLRKSLYPLILTWQGQLPNIRDVFRLEEIDLLITDDMVDRDILIFDASFIDFLINIGYRDEPDVDEDGKPLLLRTTAVHRAFGRENFGEIDRLFQIYNRFDVNYTDENGLTHFHVACEYGCTEVVEKFLELGQDPNILLPETGDSPLHLTQEYYTSKEVTELLLRYGADPNWANKKGLTPLHLINENLTAEVFFKISDDRCQPLQVNARDEDGNTPLHFAAARDNDKFIELLLRNGANPNLANEDGVTPLHVLSARNQLSIIELFFKINDELNQQVHIDARDKFGQTPLQWAVANHCPVAVDVLLDHGADLSCFVYPSTSNFDEFFEENCGGGQYDMYLFKTLAALSVVERLENRGYELSRSDALTIMTFLVKHIVRCYDDEDEKEVRVKKFTAETKKMMVSPDLSLYDLIQLRPKEAEKQLTYKNCYELPGSEKLGELLDRCSEACAVHLCEKLTRGFFQRWALDPLLKLTCYRLPILCCEMIAEQLMSQDLCNVCLAAASPSP